MSTDPVSYNDELEWEFGDRIRKVRRRIAHMSQTEMAVTLGVSQKVYATWEAGRSEPGDIVGIAKRVQERWPGRVTAAWMLGIGELIPPNPPRSGASSNAGAGLLLPRLDSNQEPADVLPQIDKTAA
jgi:DNA-binding XRE family transcriptional regulator